MQGADYMDPNAFVSDVSVRALYDYRAQKSDELSFPRGAVITNVSRQSANAAGWWRGDYNGKLQHWFPANFVAVRERKIAQLIGKTGASFFPSCRALVLLFLNENLRHGIAFSYSGRMISLWLELT